MTHLNPFEGKNAVQPTSLMDSDTQSQFVTTFLWTVTTIGEF